MQGKANAEPSEEGRGPLDPIAQCLQSLWQRFSGGRRRRGVLDVLGLREFGGNRLGVLEAGAGLLCLARIGASRRDRVSSRIERVRPVFLRFCCSKRTVLKIPPTKIRMVNHDLTKM